VVILLAAVAVERTMLALQVQAEQAVAVLVQEQVALQVLLALLIQAVAVVAVAAELKATQGEQAVQV